LDFLSVMDMIVYMIATQDIHSRTSDFENIISRQPWIIKHVIVSIVIKMVDIFLGKASQHFVTQIRHMPRRLSKCNQSSRIIWTSDIVNCSGMPRSIQAHLETYLSLRVYKKGMCENSMES
jgi:hypothetical protein